MLVDGLFSLLLSFVESSENVLASSAYDPSGDFLRQPAPRAGAGTRALCPGPALPC